MKQFCLGILVLGEVKWAESGLEKLDDGYTLAFSRNLATHHAGVYYGF